MVHMFVIRMRFSSVVFAQAFPTEKLEALLEGHRLGVPVRLAGKVGKDHLDNRKPFEQETDDDRN